MIKKSWKEGVLGPHLTIKEAFSNLNQTGLQIIFVCGPRNKLIGTITDGDIRRGLLKGMGLNEKIAKIVNKNPIVISNDIDRITALKIMNANKIKSLPVLNKRGELIESYTANELKNNHNESEFDVVIMAGGKGKRLLPITKNTPKAMVKLNGKPIIEIMINNFIKFGFNSFYISVNHLKQKIIRYLGSGKKIGVNINYLREKKPLGTIGSLSLLKKISKNFLVINCDVITSLNFAELIKFHLNSKSALTIAANIVEQLNNFGEIKTDGNRVLSFIEKPVEKKYNNAGIYVFNKSLLKYIKKNQNLDINNFVNSLLKKNIKISIFPIYENWTDIGIKSELKKIK